MELLEIMLRVKKKYHKIDSKSDPLFLLAVFFEEVGELAEAVRKSEIDSIGEELADCLFMVISLANYFDKENKKRLIKKYLENDPSFRWDLPS